MFCYNFIKIKNTFKAQNLFNRNLRIFPNFRMEIYLCFFSLPHSIVPKTKKLLFPFSRMAQKIYSETFITSKNPTE